MVSRVLAAFLALLVLAPAASAQPAPGDLRAFLLRATEPGEPTRTFPRTPSFAWNPVRGATSYEFQLSASRTFAENAIVWEHESLKAPLTTIPITLPWTTGSPFSFYARVRANRGDGAGAWSARYGFRLRSPSPPTSLSSGLNPQPGLVRWTPVDGATAYEVTFQYNLGFAEKKLVKTQTTAADLREYYTLHNWLPLTLPTLWRVRAVRELEGEPMNRLPAASYGPWSPTFETVDPPLSPGVVQPRGALSRSRAADVASAPAPSPGPGPHELFPGFWWTGTRSIQDLGACPPDVAALGVTCPLFHVYVYTDEDCVNRVHASDLVGSPGYAPRLTPPLRYPGDPNKLAEIAPPGGGAILLGDGEEGKVYDAGGEQVFAAGTDELLPPAEEPRPGQKPDRRSGIWDSDWPDNRYYWTAVPAVPRITPEGQVEYHDVGFGEDMCLAGRFGTFGKTSAPAIERANGAPFASGMTPSGAVRGAPHGRPAFVGRVVVAWQPAPGATRYQVQWSRRASPFRPVGSATTPATASVLALAPGVWYYRVRGLDRTIPGRLQGMTWSDPQYLKVVPRTFIVTTRRR